MGRRTILIWLLCLLLAGCSAVAEEPATTPEISPATETTAAPTAALTTQPTEPPDPIGEILAEMTLQQKVGQLFLARCDDTTALGDIETYHLAGFVLFGRDFQNQTPESMTQKLLSYQQAAQIPLLMAVDEEGGTVARVSRYKAFRQERFLSPRELFAQGGMAALLETEREKAGLLASLGINVNLGAVCDITTAPEAFMYRRSLGQSPEVTARLVKAMVRTMDSYGIGSVLKHFPGYGNNADTHTGIARDSRTLESLAENDLIPFQAGIDAGCGAIMVSHTIVEAMDPQLPASLSPAVHAYLREEMGFDGVIVTDDLAMEAITDLYGGEEAAVLAVLAGNDLLCATAYREQYAAVLAAAEAGRIDMALLDSAVRRVLRWKMDLGLITENAGNQTSAHKTAKPTYGYSHRSVFFCVSDLVRGALVRLFSFWMKICVNHNGADPGFAIYGARRFCVLLSMKKAITPTGT